MARLSSTSLPAVGGSPRQTRHALAVVAGMPSGRRRLVRACAEEYLSQVDRQLLPVGYDQPIAVDRANRADAYRMRRGQQFAQMLGISCNPADADLPETARAVLAAVDAPVQRLTVVASASGQPFLVALLHVAASAPAEVA